LILVFTSMVDTVSLLLLPWATKAVLPSGVRATVVGAGATAMSSGSLVLVFTSIVDTVLLTRFWTKAALPSGVTTRWSGVGPAGGGGKVSGVLGRGLDVDRRQGAAALVGDEGGLTVRRQRESVWASADRDVGRVLHPGLHVDGRHRLAAGVDDEGSLAVRGQ